MNRVILHSDMNSFYASVEIMLNPSLKGKAVAVCGNTEERHGIILAKSDPAKKCGVKTGMAAWEAERLCRDIILVPPQYDEYLKYSKLAREIYSDYTDMIEPYGMDECWLDVTGSDRLFGSGEEIAHKIRRRIKEELNLTVSVGVSFNKVFAKLASDMKKPDAVNVIDTENFREKVWKLPAQDLLYVGRATGEKLRKLGIHTIGDIAETEERVLKGFLGVNGIYLKKYAMGLDDSPVTDMYSCPLIKSVGHGITCVSDLNTDYEVWKVMLELSQDIGYRLRKYDLKAGGVQLSIRNRNLRFHQFQGMLDICTQSPSVIASKGMEIFKGNYDWNIPVRAVGIRAIKLLDKDSFEQLSIFCDGNSLEKINNRDLCIEKIRSRFGRSAIKNAVLMGDLKMPDDGREKVIMPGNFK